MIQFSFILHFFSLALVSSAFAALRPGKSSESARVVSASDAYFHHSAAQRVNTDAVMFQVLTDEHPDSQVTIVVVENCDLFSYAGAGLASATLLENSSSLASHKWRMYAPPLNRIDGDNGTLNDSIKFGLYRYEWKKTDLLVYYVEGRDGDQFYPALPFQYVIGPPEVVDDLVAVIGDWSANLHNEIWSFDGGWWQKDRLLYEDVQKASWENVILDQELKDALIDNVQRFFNSRDQYKQLGVPWKRGLIFHGPPGNGKTISIKATMKTLYARANPIPTLYVRTLSGYGEWALREIFSKAREQAPCYLVFEDLDSLVTPNIRSYFLNQIDGLQPNDGILMVGSTNHLERLDPGISRRPSRFDRKFYFPNPSFDQRVQYCAFWRHKLGPNKELEFPVELESAIANITDGFSFAYIQEAFVASLLLIANEGEKGALQWIVDDVSMWNRNQQLLLLKGGGKSLEDLLLWRVMKKQIEILRGDLEVELNEEVDIEEDNAVYFGKGGKIDRPMRNFERLIW